MRAGLHMKGPSEGYIGAAIVEALDGGETADDRVEAEEVVHLNGKGECVDEKHAYMDGPGCW